MPRHVRTTLLQDERARRRTSVVERHAPPRNDVLVLLPPRRSRRRRQRPRHRSPGSREEGQAARALVARRLRPIPARVRDGIAPEIRARGDILCHRRRCLVAVLRPPPAPPPPRARGGARPTAAISIVPPTAISFAFNSSSTSLAAIEAVCNSAAALFAGLFRAAQVLRRQTPNPEMLYSDCWVILQTWTCRSNCCNMHTISLFASVLRRSKEEFAMVAMVSLLYTLLEAFYVWHLQSPSSASPSKLVEKRGRVIPNTTNLILASRYTKKETVFSRQTIAVRQKH